LVIKSIIAIGKLYILTISHNSALGSASQDLELGLDSDACWGFFRSI